MDNDDESTSNSKSDNENNDTDKETVAKIDWKTETTIQEGNNLEIMIKKANKHVQQAKNMQLLLSGKGCLAQEW
jgi:hypothetical protein